MGNANAGYKSRLDRREKRSKFYRLAKIQVFFLFLHCMRYRKNGNKRSFYANRGKIDF